MIDGLYSDDVDNQNQFMGFYGMMFASRCVV